MGLPLAISGLRVASPGGRMLLDLPDLTVAPGTCLGVSGPSGAGKSTFLYAVAGLLAASGQVRWGETDLLGLGSARRTAFRAQHMGFIFQDFMLFDELSALGNAGVAACYAPRRDRQRLRRRAEEGLRTLGLGHGQRRVDTFSGGERQRVAIARALAADPTILLADEPTASLHREASEAIVADLTALAREHGRTLIAVSHDRALLDRMDRVLRLENGVPLAERAAA